MNWMQTREGTMKSSVFGETLHELYPIIEKGASDSGTVDNVLEFMCRSGQDITQCALTMIPEAWQNDHNMDPDRRAFYQFQSMLMEPWDGPALVAFTDGDLIGCVLDRNGLRPGRYYVTRDHKVVCASEVGVYDVDPEDVVEKGRLCPGRVFIVDVENGCIVDDNDMKAKLASVQPYAKWIRENMIDLTQHPVSDEELTYELMRDLEGGDFNSHLRAFGYTSETCEKLLGPMASNAYEALGSMGNDVPLACLSSLPRPPYDYFKQMFAHVTNPPIDPIRERIVTSLQCPIGPEGNLLHPDAQCASRVSLKRPVLSPSEFLALTHLPGSGWSTAVIDTTFKIPISSGNGNVMMSALSRICNAVAEAAQTGNAIIVLSDRATSSTRVPISSLMVVGAVHHHLVSLHLRSKVALICEAGDAREVHHFCTLLGFGADAIYPYLAIRVIYDGKIRSLNDSLSPDGRVENYLAAAAKGITKVMAKMGISTLQSYKGAQVFEAIGIDAAVMAKCFRQAHSRIGGVGFDTFVSDALRLHRHAFNHVPSVHTASLSYGEFHFRNTPGSEIHLNDPSAIAALQEAARGNDKAAMKRYTDLSNRLTSQSTLRGLLRLKCSTRDAILIDDVEPAASIVRRFCTGAMSFGSISRPAHATLAVAMNRIGGKSNTGEGGEEEDRWAPMPNGDSMRSAIKQVASGRFGVTVQYLNNSDEIQIKMAQGAKPGEGGELPGDKVQGNIAKARRSTPGVGLISPPPHHDVSVSSVYCCCFFVFQLIKN